MPNYVKSSLCLQLELLSYMSIILNCKVNVESGMMWNMGEKSVSYEMWPSVKYDMIIVAPNADELIYVK